MTVPTLLALAGMACFGIAIVLLAARVRLLNIRGNRLQRVAPHRHLVTDVEALAPYIRRHVTAHARGAAAENRARR